MKRRRRNELGRRSIKPNARQLLDHAGRIRKANRLQPTKDHQLNHRRKKATYSYWKLGNEIKKFVPEKHQLKDATDLKKIHSKQKKPLGLLWKQEHKKWQ
jgi:hypothetical protein